MDDPIARTLVRIPAARGAAYQSRGGGGSLRVRIAHTFFCLWHNQFDGNYFIELQSNLIRFVRVKSVNQLLLHCPVLKQMIFIHCILVL